MINQVQKSIQKYVQVSDFCPYGKFLYQKLNTSITKLELGGKRKFPTIKYFGRK